MPKTPDDPLTALLENDEEARRFFDSLPAVTQSTLRQSGIVVNTRRELISAADGFMQRP